MEYSTKKKLFYFFILIFLLLVITNNYSISKGLISVKAFRDDSPLWITQGTYMELSYYSGENLRIGFIDGKDYVGDKVTLKWECLDLKNTLAKIELTLKLYSGDTVSKEFSITTLVNISNRDVFSLDGNKYYGKTAFWLPTNVRDGEQVSFGYSNITIVGTIRKGNTNIKTPYGYQKVFTAKLKTEKDTLVPYKGKEYNISLYNFLEYDEDTGVLIGTLTSMGEGILYALGVLITPPLRVNNTNIDLGPELITPLVVNTLIGIAPVIIFLVLFVVIYIHKKKQKRLKRRYAKIKQKH